MEENKGYLIENSTIIMNRGLTELDKFLRDFLDIMKKYSDYLVVSGFVSISSGRTRGTEDIDILVPVLSKKKFCKMFTDLIENEFWCYQSENCESAYEYIEKLNSIRFARKDEMFPNIEFIPINETKKAKFFEFTHPQKMKIEEFEFLIPPIEFEILYKEMVLGGKKDIADAKHLREFFSDIIDKNKLKEYQTIIEGELK